MECFARPLQITPEMMAAGEAAFMEWFRQPHLAVVLPSLPEKGDIQALSSAIFASMILFKPLV